jgi:hypothetical protein
MAALEFDRPRDAAAVARPTTVAFSQPDDLAAVARLMTVAFGQPDDPAAVGRPKTSAASPGSAHWCRPSPAARGAL